MLEDLSELLVRYCDAVDAADWDELGSLFEHGRLVDQDGNELASGAAGVAAFFRRSVLLHDGSPRTKHLVSNTMLTGELEARSSFLVLQALDGFPLQPIIAGTYHDTFARSDDGRLCFEERRFSAELVGEVSRHLRFELSRHVRGGGGGI